MKQAFTNEEQAIRYFLGELSENEKSAVEEHFFADEDFSRFLDAAEKDLIDDYVGDRLDFLQKQNFESRFLISERRRDAVRAARILQTELLVKKEKEDFFAAKVSLRQRLEELFRFRLMLPASGFAALAILFSLGVFWLIRSPENDQTARIENENHTRSVEIPKPPPVLSAMNDSSPNLNKTQRSRQNLLVENKKPKLSVKPKNERREKPPVVSPAKLKSNPAFTLLPLTQTAEKSLIVGAPDAKNIRLRVVHNNAENFIKYRVEIHASDGDLIWSREIVVSEKTLHKPLALDVRSGALASGAYKLTMNGATGDGQLEEINSFNFSVQKN